MQWGRHLVPWSQPWTTDAALCANPDMRSDVGQLAWGAQTGWEAKTIHRDLCWGIFTEEFVSLESKWLITFFPPIISKVKKKPCNKNDTGGLPWWHSGLRIRLPTQGTQVRALVREDPTCRGATKPMRRNY